MVFISVFLDQLKMIFSHWLLRKMSNPLGWLSIFGLLKHIQVFFHDDSIFVSMICCKKKAICIFFSISIFPWLSQSRFPIAFRDSSRIGPSFPNHFTWASHGFSIYFLLCFHIFPLIFQWCSSCFQSCSPLSHRLPSIFPWISTIFPMILPRRRANGMPGHPPPCTSPIRGWTRLPVLPEALHHGCVGCLVWTGDGINCNDYMVLMHMYIYHIIYIYTFILTYCDISRYNISRYHEFEIL